MCGQGFLMARRLVDELIRGEKGNEVLLVKLVSISESQSGPGSNSLRETDWNTDADSDADRSIRANGTPERLSLSGSHGQRPWV